MVRNICGKIVTVQNYKDENVWCTQKAMAMLFDCSTDNVGLHLKNIFASGELEKDTVTEKISATASDGKNYLTQFYSLDAIIAVICNRIGTNCVRGMRELVVRKPLFCRHQTPVLYNHGFLGVDRFTQPLILRSLL